MVETFTRKKVSSLTLGEKLSKFRGEARLTVSDVAKATKIQAKYIEALEKGDYNNLPADVYVRGYLRSYARYLNIEEKSLVRLYEQERSITKTITPDTPRKNVFAEENKRTYVITSKALVMGGIVIAILGAAVYLWFQFRTFTTEPLLVISEPNPNVVIGGRTVVLKGKTDRGAQVIINDKATLVSPEGTFQEEITLQRGINQVSVRAVNRFNKEKQETLQLEAQFEEPKVLSSSDLALQKAASEGVFRVALSLKEIPTKVTVTSDGKVVFDEVLGVGDPKVFEAKERLVVQAADGSQVLVKTAPESEATPLGTDAKKPSTRTFPLVNEGESKIPDTSANSPTSEISGN
jgi:transcriptional regulator with XRE-family HTH domain